MISAKTLYRSTLIAAALAAGSVGVLPVAAARDHGWRGRDGDRGWYERDRDGRSRGDHGWHRDWARRWYGDQHDQPVGWDAYPPAPPGYGRDGDVAIVNRVPF